MISKLAQTLATVTLLGLATVPATQAQWTTITSQNTLASHAPISGRPSLLKVSGGGTFVLWEDVATGVRLQYIDAAGFRQPVDRLVDPLGEQAVMSTDGSGGVFVAWQTLSGAIMAHRFDAALDPLWFFPVGVVSVAGAQSQPSIVTDQAGGAIIAWTDKGQDPQGDIYAQRFGGLGWTSLGQHR